MSPGAAAAAVVVAAAAVAAAFHSVCSPATDRQRHRLASLLCHLTFQIIAEALLRASQYAHCHAVARDISSPRVFPRAGNVVKVRKGKEE